MAPASLAASFLMPSTLSERRPVDPARSSGALARRTGATAQCAGLTRADARQTAEREQDC